MELSVIGINFKTAPLELRERLSYDAAQARGALGRLHAALPGVELMLVSTCNRTELYAAAEGALDEGSLSRALLGDAGAQPGDALLGHVYVKRGKEAVAHLMAVAAGLDSLVVGETEVLGQVKQAYQHALEAGATGPYLNALAQQVLRVAKRVRTETGLARGRVSVGSIAVDLAGKVFDDLAGKKVLILGAGRIGELALRALVSRGVRAPIVVNRSLERARAMADQYQGTAATFERLAEYLPQADIVISATSAPQCVLDTATVRRAMASRHGRPMLCIDLAVPRDIEEAVARVENVYLYNLDDLESVASENLARRREAVEEALRMVREEASAVAAAIQAAALGIGAVMKQLDEAAAAIREAELARVFAKEKVAPLGPACDACREEICAMLQRALAKMLDGPKRALAEAARTGDFEEFIRVAARLYGIRCETPPEPPRDPDET